MELRRSSFLLLGMETAAELRAVGAVSNVGTLPGVVVVVLSSMAEKPIRHLEVACRASVAHARLVRVLVTYRPRAWIC